MDEVCNKSRHAQWPGRAGADHGCAAAAIQLDGADSALCMVSLYVLFSLGRPVGRQVLAGISVARGHHIVLLTAVNFTIMLGCAC